MKSIPYELKKDGNQYCVHKKGGGKVPGGCHPTRAEALKHMSALYVNVEGKTDPPATVESAQQIAADNGWKLEKIEGTNYWAIRNVPIASTGIEYPLASGQHTFTPEDLKAAIDAQADPAIVQPRIWLGHDDPRFNGDGEPALGRVEGMRLSEDEQTIYGDYVGLPEWLAKIMPVAYPSRSIEGQINAQTVTGNKYSLVITAVKQLGVVWPGISVLEDIPLLLSDAGPKGVQLTAAWKEQIAAQMNVEDVRRHFYDMLRADNDPNKKWWWIRVQQVVSGKGQLIVDDDNGKLYRIGYDIDGDEIMFDDPVPVQVEYEDAQVAASAITSHDIPMVVYASKHDSWANGEVAAASVTDSPWDDRSSRYDDEQYFTACVLDRGDCAHDWKNMPVKSRYTLPIREPNGALNRNGVRKAAGRLSSMKACVAAKQSAAVKIQAAFASLKEDPPDDVKMLAASRQTEGGSMDEETRQLLAAKLGLPPESTEEQIDAHLAELKASTESPTPEPEEEEAGGEAEEEAGGDSEDEAEEEGGDETVAGKRKKEGVVQVDAETWEETRKGAQLAAKMYQDGIEAENTRTVVDAIKAGKFPPSRKEHYLKLMKADRDGTIEMIGGLQAGLIPVDERGSASGSEELKAGQENSGNGEIGLPDNWFPEVGAIKARAAQERRIYQAKEG